MPCALLLEIEDAFFCKGGYLLLSREGAYLLPCSWEGARGFPSSRGRGLLPLEGFHATTAGICHTHVIYMQWLICVLGCLCFLFCRLCLTKGVLCKGT